MIPLSFTRDKTYAVFALGVSGMAAVRALIAGGARVIAWDGSEAARAEAAATGAALHDLATHDLAGIDALVLSPGIPTQFPAPHPIVARFQQANIPIVSDIALLLESQQGARIIGITGTNGKSTTTALLAHVLDTCGVKNAVGGNLGPAALSLPPMLAGAGDAGTNGTYVLELSSYQLDLTPQLTCDIAIILNITPDHLDRHGGMEGYIAAKASILRHMAGPQTFIIGVDDVPTGKLAEAELAHHDSTVVPISAAHALPKGIYVAAGKLFENGAAIGDVSGIAALPGTHNAQNIAAAYAVARACGLDAEPILAAIRAFPGLAHRQQPVETIDGVLFVNDSKATNVDAAEKALVCYDPIYWIAGGRAKDGGFAALTPHLDHIRHAFLIGEAAPALADWLTAQGKDFTVSETLERAVKAAATLAFEEDLDNATVLLSPACASFDQFPNFEARGDLFINAVRGLMVGAAG